MSVTDAPVDGEIVVAGRYRRDFHLGTGGMGTVWAATDLVLHRWVALKCVDLRPGSSAAAARMQLLDEAKAAARLNHPGVVTVHDVVDAGDELLLVSEYLGGGTLTDHIRRHGRIDPGAVATLGARLAAGVAAAHAAAVVHADVKPSNVLLVGSDPTEAKLADFGVARFRGSSGAPTDGSVGTPAYLPPERLAGHEPAEPGDVYSLGATLWFALTGRSPFERATVDATLDAVAADPLPPIDVAGPAVDLVARALDRNPLRRPTATELATAFAALAPSPLPVAAPAAPTPHPPVAAPVAVPTPTVGVDRAVDETITLASSFHPSVPQPPAAGSAVTAATPRRGRKLVVAGAALAVLGAGLIGASVLLDGDDGPQDEQAVVADDEPANDGADAPAADEPAATPQGPSAPQATPDTAPPDTAPPAATPPAQPGAEDVHVDPQGHFSVVLPEGVTVELDEATHVTQATDGDLRIAIRWFDDPVDPAAFIADEEARLTTFPGYERLRLDTDGGEVTWSFTFAQPSDPDRLLSSTGRAFVVDGRTYAIFVRATDAAEVDDVLTAIDGSFVPTP